MPPREPSNPLSAGRSSPGRHRASRRPSCGTVRARRPGGMYFPALAAQPSDRASIPGARERAQGAMSTEVQQGACPPGAAQPPRPLRRHRPAPCWTSRREIKLFRAPLAGTSALPATWQRCDTGILPLWWDGCAARPPTIRGPVRRGPVHRGPAPAHRPVVQPGFNAALLVAPETSPEWPVQRFGIFYAPRAPASPGCTRPRMNGTRVSPASPPPSRRPSRPPSRRPNASCRWKWTSSKPAAEPQPDGNPRPLREEKGPAAGFHRPWDVCSSCWT